jgi:hypothetical protein
MGREVEGFGGLMGNRGSEGIVPSEKTIRL